jgi:metal-responsive CopG/Arc/MetJ family transcriptional regulator
MFGGMKVKTSVTLSQELLDAIERTCGGAGHRSEFLERVAWRALREQWRREREERDAAIYRSLPPEHHAEVLQTLADFGVDPLTLGDEFQDEDFANPPTR